MASRGGPRLPPPCCDLLSRCFSIKYFTYANLLEKAGLHGDSPLRRLFDALSTLDFEVVVHALEGAALVEQTYNKKNGPRFCRPKPTNSAVRSFMRSG